jgi:hypothetical protein
MSCLSEHLLRRLAEHLTEDTLEILRRLPGRESEALAAATAVAAAAAAAAAGVRAAEGRGLEGGTGEGEIPPPPRLPLGVEGSTLLVSKLYRLKLEQMLESRGGGGRCGVDGRGSGLAAVAAGATGVAGAAGVAGPSSDSSAAASSAAPSQSMASVGRGGGCVARCGACGRLYSAAARATLLCPRARVYVDFDGNVIGERPAGIGFSGTKLIL